MNEQNYESLRRAMVASQLRTSAVSDPRVVAAMGEVPRERFVPVTRRQLAYVDTPVPLGAGRALNLPMVTGRLLTEAAVAPTDHVLVVGAATGYASALLAKLAASVVAVESDAALVAAMREALGATPAVTIVEGPLAEGAADHAPFDLILIDGAIEQLPDALKTQLKPGGRIACALIEGNVTRLAIGRIAGDSVGFQIFADAEAVPLPGFARPRQFSF